MTRFMGQTGLSGKQRCAVRCRVSDKHRDAPGGPVWRSGQRCSSLMMPGITALGAPCRKTGEPGEMGHYLCTLVLACRRRLFADEKTDPQILGSIDGLAIRL